MGDLALTRARLAAFALVCALASSARAQISELPDSLARAALAEHKATAMSPAELDGADYRLVRVAGSAPFEVSAVVEPGSVRFVRVADHVVVPRGVR